VSIQIIYKLNERSKRIFGYFSIFIIVLGTTFGSINSANAADVVIAAGETVTTFGDDDTITVTGATATIDLEGEDQAATLTSTADVDTALTIDSGTSMGFEEDITAAAGSTLSINIIQGSLILEGDAIETSTGVGTINVGAGDELNIAGEDTAIAYAITSTDATSTLHIEGTVTFSDTVSVGVLVIEDDTTFSSTLTVSGETNMEGDITIAGDATFSSDTEPIFSDTLTFTGSTLTVSGDGGFIITDADNAKLLVDGGVTQTIAAGIKPDTNNEAILENSNVAATVTFEEQIGTVGGDLMKLIDTDTGTTSVFKKEVGTVLFTVDGTATLTLDGNQATNLDINTAGILIIDDTITNGQEVFLAGTSVVDGSVAGTGNIQMPANLLDSETIVLIAEISGVTRAIVEDVQEAVLDTALRTYTASRVFIGEGDVNIIITAADNSASIVASNLGTTTNMGTALIQAGIAVETDATALDAFSNALNANGYSATEDTALAKQVAPQDDMISGSTFATKAMTGSLQGIMSNRMASLRSGEAYYGSGMSAGANMSANSGFIQVFGTDAEQKNKTVGSGTQFGYDASSSGVALGFDGITDNGSVVGLSLSMSETDVDGKGTGNSKNDIDSYTASIYMDKSTGAGYVEGSLTVGLNENNSSRIVNTAGLDRTYKGDYDSEQVSLKIGGGKPNAVGMSSYVTPFGSITATRISTDTYTETSTTAGDNLRLRVAQDDVDSVVGTVGLKYHTILDNGGSPMISLAINNEFGDSTINSTNTYQGGGSSFKTSTDVEELSATLGLGYSFSSDNASIEFAYEADANDDDYLSHYGSIKLVSKF